MASHWFKAAKLNMAKGDLDYDVADLRLVLLMTNTTADTDKDAITVGAFVTLDEYDGTGYSRVALTGEVVAYDDVNDRVEIDCADLAPWFAAVGAATRQAQGFMVIRFITNDTDNIPLFWIDTGGFPFSGNGGVVNLTINAEGLAQIT